MDRLKLPGFAPVEKPALLEMSEPGITIVGPELASLEARFCISGRFIIPKKEYERLNRVPHKHLVLTILRKSQYGSFHPLKNCLIFQDDVQEMSDAYSGWFSLDVWEYSSFRYEGTYFVRVSLGTALSNVVKATMSSPGT